MSMIRRAGGSALLGVVALGVSLAVTPAAQAATTVQSTATHTITYQRSGTTHAAAVRPMTTWVNCSTGTFGTSGGQWYFQIACSPVQATSWDAGVYCSDNLWHLSSFYTTFENVQIYCPVGTVAEQGGVFYTS